MYVILHSKILNALMWDMSIIDSSCFHCAWFFPYSKKLGSEWGSWWVPGTRYFSSGITGRKLMSIFHVSRTCGRTQDTLRRAVRVGSSWAQVTPQAAAEDTTEQGWTGRPLCRCQPSSYPVELPYWEVLQTFPSPFFSFLKPKTRVSEAPLMELSFSETSQEFEPTTLKLLWNFSDCSSVWTKLWGWARV